MVYHEQWLEDFAYSISINRTVFMASSMIAISIAVLTMGFLP